MGKRWAAASILMSKSEYSCPVNLAQLKSALILVNNRWRRSRGSCITNGDHDFLLTRRLLVIPSVTPFCVNVPKCFQNDWADCVCGSYW